jgi:hypothetical protein
MRRQFRHINRTPRKTDTARKKFPRGWNISFPEMGPSVEATYRSLAGEGVSQETAQTQTVGLIHQDRANGMNKCSPGRRLRCKHYAYS